MRFFVKRLVLVVLAILLTVLPTGGVFALSNSLMDLYSQNEIMFYEPDACKNPTPGKICTAVSGSDITWIGDSLTALRFQDSSGKGAEAALKERFPGVDYGGTFNGTTINDYVRSGKKVYGDNPDGPSGLNILENIVNQGKLRKVLVFELGANNGGWQKAWMDKLFELVGNNTTVVVLNSYVIGKTGSTNLIDNSFLDNVSSAEYPNLVVGDWASVLAEHHEYFQTLDYDGTHFNAEGHDAFLDFILGLLSGVDCSTDLCGTTAKEKYWVAIRQYFDEGATAGIIGNVMNEGMFNPVGTESGTWLWSWDFGNLKSYGMTGTNTWGNGWSWDRYYNNDCSTSGSHSGCPSGGQPTGVGAFGITAGRSAYLHHINDVAPQLIKYFKDPGTYDFTGLGWSGYDTPGDALLAKIGDEDYDALVKLEVEWMYDTFLAKIGQSEIDRFNNMNASDAAVYFAQKYEVCYKCDSAEVQQRRSGWGNDAFGQLSGFSCSARSVSSGSSSGFTSMETLSGTNNYKYDMIPKDIRTLLQFAIWKGEREDRDYQDVLSKVLGDYEQSGEGERGNAQDFMKYVRESEKFKYRGDFDRFIKEKPKITVTSEQQETADNIFKNGIERTTSEGRVKVTNDLPKGADECEGRSNRSKGAARIAEAAAMMSWPVQVGQGDDKHAGMCFDGQNWIQYNHSTGTCAHVPRPLYKEVFDSHDTNLDYYEDCGRFMSAVLYYLELDEDNKAGWYHDKNAFFRASSEWEEVENIGSYDNLQPGDIFTSPGHAAVYIGSYGGDFGIMAHASAHEWVGRINGGTGYTESGKINDGTGRPFGIYRYVGSKLGSADIDEDKGLTYEQAKQFMINYGANLNDSSRKIVGDDQWYINCNGNNRALGLGGSNCVTFSAFFAGKFTSMKYGGGNGDMFVDQAKGSFTRGAIPKIWAIFSASPNHTGVILGKEGDEWIVGHASCRRDKVGKGDGTEAGSGTGFVKKSANIIEAFLESPFSFAYPASVDFDAIERYLETGE
ncbi:MAG: hypothetical protein Q4A70_01205 [Candidatus Saccharibacteria bacterium]|nr:hypothetical protein [Candidatus Saccharibacteria bacterium]